MTQVDDTTPLAYSGDTNYIAIGNNNNNNSVNTTNEADGRQGTVSFMEMTDPFKWDRKTVAGTSLFMDFTQAEKEEFVPKKKFLCFSYGGKSKPHVEHKLSQWLATSICGNDIASSCLYVVGLCAFYAGIWAPVALFMVAILLYLFRSIYTEVGSALPLNGASYTLLLNTTSKPVASLAACLTLISYTATAVVSGSDAVDYCVSGVPYCDYLNVKIFTVCLLLFFAILNIIGITESAIVALIIFSVHLATLGVLLVCCLIFTIQNRGEILINNWMMPSQHSIVYSIFFGFAAAMLGITGFESSANFIEQQKDGVFRKTLRNMWVAVGILNPSISFFSVSVLGLDVVRNPNNSSYVLSLMGRAAAGRWLQILVCADAFLVLSGGVLTSYVGVTGLIRRMSLDRCMPQFFLMVNPCFKSNHFIIIAFFLICSSMYLLLGSQIQNLAGVYTIAFLGVMFLFAFGDLILKYKRSKLPRASRAMKTQIVIAMIGCVSALLGNIFANPDYLKWFIVYYSITALLVITMVLRIKILKVVIYYVYSKLKGWKLHTTRFARGLVNFLTKQARSINSQSIIFLAKDDSMSLLNKGVLYVRGNELTDWLRIVHFYTDEEKIPAKLAENVAILDKIYPKMRIDLLCVKGEFGPDAIDRLSRETKVPKNLIFISCPGDKFAHKLADLGGVRIITTD